MHQNAERAFVPMMLAILAYQRLASGLNAYGVAHGTVLAVLIETGELFTGISFVILAVQSFRGYLHARWLQLGVATGLISALMNLESLFCQGSNTLFTSGDPFAEGAFSDMLMFLIQLGVAAVFWFMRRVELRLHTPL